MSWHVLQTWGETYLWFTGNIWSWWLGSLMAQTRLEYVRTSHQKYLVVSHTNVETPSHICGLQKRLTNIKSWRPGCFSNPSSPYSRVVFKLHWCSFLETSWNKEKVHSAEMNPNSCYVFKHVCAQRGRQRRCKNIINIKIISRLYRKLLTELNWSVGL